MCQNDDGVKVVQRRADPFDYEIIDDALSLHRPAITGAKEGRMLSVETVSVQFLFVDRHAESRAIGD